MKKFLKVVLSSLGLLFVVFSLGFKGNATTTSVVKDGITYNKVTSQADITDGNYLIAYETNYMGGFESKYFKQETIESAYIFNIYQEEGNYIIEFDDNGTPTYVGHNNSKNAAYQTTNKMDSKIKTKWNIIYEDAVKIENIGCTSYKYLQYNTNNPRFACYNGGQKYLDLYKAEIAETPVVAESFIASNTKSSLKVVYDIDTQNATDVDLRFGSLMSASTYVEGAKYGVIVMPKGELSFTAGLQTVATAAEFVAANTSCHYLEATNIARVNAAGVEDEAGEYYQFAWVITNMEDHYQDNLVAVSYMEYEGKLYFNVSKEASVASVAETYVTEGIVADEVLVNVLKKLYE